MNKKQKQLQYAFEASDTTMVGNSEIEDMIELFSYSFEDYLSQVEHDIAQFPQGQTSMMQSP